MRNLKLKKKSKRNEEQIYSQKNIRKCCRKVLCDTRNDTKSYISHDTKSYINEMHEL